MLHCWAHVSGGIRSAGTYPKERLDGARVRTDAGKGEPRHFLANKGQEHKLDTLALAVTIRHAQKAEQGLAGRKLRQQLSVAAAARPNNNDLGLALVSKGHPARMCVCIKVIFLWMDLFSSRSGSGVAVFNSSKAMHAVLRKKLYCHHYCRGYRRKHRLDGCVDTKEQTSWWGQRRPARAG